MRRMADDNNVLELDPEVWKDLPQELLEGVVAKLPFSRAVAFRAVCRLWNSDIIPRAAPHVEASKSCTLLFFDRFGAGEESEGCAWWLQFCKPNSAQEKFQHKSFPSPKPGEDVVLMESQGGLLFFGFSNQLNQRVRDIVVCNPLVGKCKSLGLPDPGRSQFLWSRPGTYLLLGVVFDENTVNYRLVVAGVDVRGQHKTVLYNSSTCTWTNRTSLLPTLQEISEELVEIKSKRSVCCNGSLYWHIVTKSPLYDDVRHRVLKCDIDNDHWRVIFVFESRCEGVLRNIGHTQMVSFEGEIFAWHLNALDSQPPFVTMKTFESLKRNMLGPNCSWYPENMNCSCDEEVLEPEIIRMQHNRPHFLGRIDGLLSLYKGIGYACRDYLAFSQQKFIYHVLELFYHPEYSTSVSRRGRSGSENIREPPPFSIVVHDTELDLYTEFARPKESAPLQWSSFTTNIWSFSGSLTSMP